MRDNQNWDMCRRNEKAGYTADLMSEIKLFLRKHVLNLSLLLTFVNLAKIFTFHT